MDTMFNLNVDSPIGDSVDDLDFKIVRDPSDQIIDTKNWRINEWLWKANDGHVIMTLSNIMFKALLVQDKNGIRYTDVLSQFDQYNNTQNDKGTHQCSMDIFLQDAQGQTLSTPYPAVFITRDVCRSLGTITLAAKRVDAVFFPIATSFGCRGRASWDYEGGC